MKTMTCKQMGGTCDTQISAESSAEMAQKMTDHVVEAHPDVAEKMANMTPEEHAAWEKKFHEDYDAAEEK